MIERQNLLDLISKSNNFEERLKIVRKYLIHGMPYVFDGRENELYEFRDLIAKNFSISFHEVLILGSAKLGFSYHKESSFSLESDIDVALVNESLFEHYFHNICDYQYGIDNGLVTMNQFEKQEYIIFLKYLVKGWMRPDKLPPKLQIKSMKQDWFDFFKSISYGHSSVGDYKVSGGLFKNFDYLEKYYADSLSRIQSH